MDRLKFTLKAWPAITLITVALCILTQFVAKLFGIELPDQANVAAVRSLLLHAFDSWGFFLRSVQVLAMVLLIMPVTEELAFRWFCFRSFESKLPDAAGPVRAVASSVLFSAAHYLQQPFPDNAFLALFFFGLAQCWLYVKTGKIGYPMLNHSLFNLTNLVLMLILPQA
jgi:membrane protease YdiL (CAAX protease family)